MKRNKVLLGLYVGLLTLAGGVANAQTGGFYEIGPDNIGGEVSSIVVDRLDTSRNTLYAGATTGGLFFRSESVDILRNFYITLGVGDSAADVLSANTDIWHRVPYKVSGKEVSLPISCMAQAPSGELFIGTEVVVEVVENCAASRFEEETAGSGASIERVAACVLTGYDDARDLTADIVRSNLIESVGLGVGNASSQSQKAYIQAEKYFVSFHKILIIN